MSEIDIERKEDLLIETVTWGAMQAEMPAGCTCKPGPSHLPMMRMMRQDTDTDTNRRRVFKLERPKLVSSSPYQSRLEKIAHRHHIPRVSLRSFSLSRCQEERQEIKKTSHSPDRDQREREMEIYEVSQPALYQDT